MKLYLVLYRHIDATIIAGVYDSFVNAEARAIQLADEGDDIDIAVAKVGKDIFGFGKVIWSRHKSKRR